MNQTSTKERVDRCQQKKASINPVQYNYSFNIRNYVNYTKFLITTVSLIFITGGIYYAFFLTPKYTATVLLSSKIYGSLSANAASIDKVIPVDDKDTSAPRQLVLIQTQKILRKLIQKLQLDLSITSETPGIPSSELAIKQITLPLYLYSTPFFITALGGGEYTLEIPSINFSSTGKIGQAHKFPLQNDQNISIAIDKLSDSATFKVIKEPQGEIINDLLNNLVFDAPGMENKLVTNIISIGYTGMDPEKTAQIVNTLADIAVEESKEQERVEAAFTVSMMEAENKYILSELNSKGLEMGVLLMELGHVSMDEKVSSKLFADDLVQLNNNIAQAHANLSSLAKAVTEKNPRYQEAQAAYQSFLQQMHQVKNKAENNVLNSNTLVGLQRDLTVYTTLYEEVCKKLEQFRARLAEPIGDLRIVEYACIPDTPSSLARPIIIILSIILGLISGYVVALVFD